MGSLFAIAEMNSFFDPVRQLIRDCLPDKQAERDLVRPGDRFKLRACGIIESEGERAVRCSCASHVCLL